MKPGHLYDNDDKFKHREIRKSGPPFSLCMSSSLKSKKSKKQKPLLGHEPPEALYGHFGETSLHNSPKKVRVMLKADWLMY
jgi:hypothetical protein